MDREKAEPLALLEQIIEHIPDMIFVKDAQTLRFVRLNKAGEELLGIPRQEMYGKSDYDFFPEHEANFFTAKDREVLRAKVPADISEEPLHTQSGERWLHTRKLPILNARMEATHLLGISTDITEKREAERALAIAEAKLREREKEDLERTLIEAQRLEGFGIMAGGIAHDFNNLLVGVLGNATLAMRSIPRESPAFALLENISSAAQRASDLTRHMLAYAGATNVSEKAIDLKVLVNETIAVLGPSAWREITLDVHIHEAVPPLSGDETQLRQLVMNLLSNGLEAIQASEVTEPNITVEVMPSATAPRSSTERADENQPPAEPWIKLSIKDNGCGMSPATARRIFDPFFTTKTTGHGLGMAAVHGIVKGHDGQIEIQSEEGAGSQILVWLPVARRDAKASASAKTKKNVPVLPLPGRLRVLVIDDLQVVLDFTQAALSHMGLEVLVATTAPEGYAQFLEAQGTIDLVILDLTIPTMVGDEFLQKLRASEPSLPIVLSSGLLESIAYKRISTEQRKNTVFLQKPYGLNDLQQVVRTLLADNPATEPAEETTAL